MMRHDDELSEIAERDAAGTALNRNNVVSTTSSSSAGGTSDSADSPADRAVNGRHSLATPLWLIATMGILSMIYVGRTLLLPIVVAMFAYLALRPLVRRGKRFNVPPAVTAAAILVLLLLLIFGAAYFVYQPAKETIARIPVYSDTVKERLGFVLDKVAAFEQAKDELTDVAEGDEKKRSDAPVPVQIKQPAWNTNVTIVSGTGNLLSFVAITLVLLYFLLATGDQVLRNVMSALPSFRARRHLFQMIERVQDGLGTYLAQVTAINFGLGVCVTVVTWLFGMPSPVLWGAMAMSFNFIPIVGAVAGAVVIFLVALVNFDQAYYAFVVTAAFLTLTTIEGQFVTPTILGRSMNISPALVMLSVVFWGWVWGLVGVFLSVPILITARLASEQYDSMFAVSKMLGSNENKAEDSTADQSQEETSVAADATPAATAV